MFPCYTQVPTDSYKISMKSDNGEIEVYLCPDVATAKPKQHRTPIPPSDPLLQDALRPKSNFSPVRAILSPNKAPGTSARRNLTFQNCTDPSSSSSCTVPCDSSSTSTSNKSKDPVFRSVGLDAIVPKVEPSYSTFTPEPSCSNTQYNDLSLDNIHLSPLNDSIKRMFEAESGSDQANSETIRLKHALISESDDFGPMGGRYPLTIEDQHSPPGMCVILYYVVHTCIHVYTLDNIEFVC